MILTPRPPNSSRHVVTDEVQVVCWIIIQVSGGKVNLSGPALLGRAHRNFSNCENGLFSPFGAAAVVTSECQASLAL